VQKMFPVFRDRWGNEINEWTDIKKGRTLVKILKYHLDDYPDQVLKTIMNFAFEKQICKQCKRRVFTITDFEGRQSGLRKNGFIWCNWHNPEPCPGCSRDVFYYQIFSCSRRGCSNEFCIKKDDPDDWRLRTGGCGENENYCSHGCFYRDHMDGWA